MQSALVKWRVGSPASLQRSGIVVGGLAALGILPLNGPRNANAGPPPPSGAAVTTRKNVCTHCSVGCSVIAKVADGIWIGRETTAQSTAARTAAKGAAVRDDVLSERRLCDPVKPVNGQWTFISWETATDEIGNRLLNIREKSGPDSIYWLGSAKFTNEATIARSPHFGGRTTLIIKCVSAIPRPLQA
jgi:formate dehydrogenase major subunit